MPHLIGPDFIGIQAEDLEAARSFYTEVVGLTAVRIPVVDLGATDRLGWGVAIWFGCDDADSLHDHLVKQGVHIEFSPKDGPFGRYFAFRDPFGYTITAHTITHHHSANA
jgi:predicted enzyme related to lactoylglutathione lyase